MHSIAQAYTKPVRFTVQTPHIKLTRNALLPSTGINATKQTTMEPLQNKQIVNDKEKPPKEKKKQKIWNDLFSFAKKEEIELIGTLFKHISSFLLLLLLITPTRNSTIYIMNSVPLIWILPVFLKLARNKTKRQVSIPVTLFYCVLFPVWMWESRNIGKTYKSALLSLCTIVVVVIANIEFVSWIAWVVFIAVVFMHVPLIIIVPQTGAAMHIVCVFVIIVMYQYEKNIPTQNTDNTDVYE